MKKMSGIQIVLITNSLGRRQYSENVHRELHSITRDASFVLFELDGLNEWVRDYLPVAGNNGKHVFFEYRPSYLKETKGGRKQIAAAKKTRNQFKKKFATDLDIDDSGIILDGG